MKKILYSLTALITCQFFMYGSCNKEKQTGNNCEQVMCTMMFAMVTAEVKDANNTSVTADNVFTIKDGNTDTLRFEQQMFNGQYVVIDDSYAKELQNKQAVFHFIGIKNGKMLFNEPYTISADCCHIKMESGKSEIITP
jgi:hypothetical protein